MSKVEYEDFQSLKPIVGFLTKPSDDAPTAVQFEGLLEAAPGRDTDNPWYVFVSMRDHKAAFYTTQEDKTKQVPVKKGDRIGVSHTGALTGLEKKLGHAFIIHYTGKKLELSRGRTMWECKVQVSKSPMKVESSMADDIPF